MNWLNALSPIVLVLVGIMLAAFILTIMSKKVSRIIARKYEGDYNLAIKLIGMTIVSLMAIIIVLLIRG